MCHHAREEEEKRSELERRKKVNSRPYNYVAEPAKNCCASKSDIV